MADNVLGNFDLLFRDSVRISTVVDAVEPMDFNVSQKPEKT